MSPFQRVAIREAISRVLVEAQHKGLLTNFCKLLEERLVMVLEKLKDNMLAPADLNTEVRVIPSSELLTILKKGAEREELEGWLGDDLADGLFKDQTTGYTSHYEFFEYQGDNPISPYSGEEMEFQNGLDFDAFWDITDIQRFDVRFKDPSLREVMDEVRSSTEDQLERVGHGVAEAMRDHDREAILLDALERQYKSSLTIPEIWEQLLDTASMPDHPDTTFKLRCWVNALGKAYGVVEDFDFDLQMADDDPSEFIVGIDTYDADEPTYGDVTHGEAAHSVALEAFRLAEIIHDIAIRHLVKTGYIDDATKNLLHRLLRRTMRSNPDIVASLVIASEKSTEPIKRLRPQLDRIRMDMASAVAEKDIDYAQ